MKTTQKLILLCLALWLCTANVTAQSYFSETISKLWETAAIFDVPESAFYDIENNAIYVSSIGGKPSEKDENGFISKIEPNGNIIKIDWITSLNGPKGMIVYNGKLYVADIDRVVEIDVKSGKILKMHQAKGAEFLNDVAAGYDGTIYISDMGTGGIYCIVNGEIKLWFPKGTFNRPNGLYFDNGNLLVGCKGSIQSINPKTKEITAVALIDGGIDGLEKDKNGNFIFSDWSGKIQKLKPGGEPVVLLNTTDEKINAADIHLIRDKNILLVPTFFDNRIMAYQINKTN
jgi:sugar lactone lactonase YvrE